MKKYKIIVNCLVLFISICAVTCFGILFSYCVNSWSDYNAVVEFYNDPIFDINSNEDLIYDPESGEYIIYDSESGEYIIYDSKNDLSAYLNQSITFTMVEILSAFCFFGAIITFVLLNPKFFRLSKVKDILSQAQEDRAEAKILSEQTKIQKAETKKQARIAKLEEGLEQLKKDE